MKKINPLGIVFLMLLVFIPKEKDEIPVNADGNATKVSAVQEAPQRMQQRTVVASELAKEPEYTVIK